MTITAVVDDSTTGGSKIASAEYSLNGGPYCKMTAQDGAFDEVAEDVKAAYAFANPGVYTVCVRGKDARGNVGPDNCSLIAAVYDPSGPYVTGGGWLNSPAGAYVANRTLTGRVNFGFVSKYLKGATVPTGQTEFQFQAAGFNFHSSSYYWLVVSGAKAQYKGSGTVNGVGGYEFLLTATDGQVTGGGGVDKLRMKIWNKATGAVVYDNLLGVSDDINLVNPQAIGGGSIVIHK